MKKRIFHKVLIPALVVMLMTPFCFTTVKADASNQDILDMLTSIRSQIVYILQTQRVSSSGNYDTVDFLQNMDTNLLSLDTHLTEIMTDMTTAWDQIDPLQTDNYFESILNYFKAFYDGISTSATHLYYIRGNTSSMITALNNIKADLDVLNNYVNQIVQGVISIDTNFQTFLDLFRNIDNTIDTISWTKFNYISSSISGNGTSGNTYENRYLQVFVGNDDVIFNNSPCIIRVKLNVIRQNSYNTWADYTIRINNDTNANFKYFIDSSYSGITYVYIYDLKSLGNSDSNRLYIRFYFDKAYYGTLFNDVSYLDSDDIEYWQLLNYFTTYNDWKQQLKDNQSIINLLNQGTSASSSTADNNDNMNQQLQTSVTQYDQVENQFKESFSTNMNQISKPDLSNIVSAAAWYTTQLTSLFNASGSFQIIYVLPLVLGIALFFIGRGAVAFRQSSNQETRWVETVKDENGFTTRHGTIRSETIRRKGRYK